MSTTSKSVPVVFLAAMLIVLPSAASAAPVVTTLGADAEWIRTVGPTQTTVTDPQSASETGTLAPLSVFSSAVRAGNGSVFEGVSVSFAGLSQGNFVFDVGWSIVTLPAVSDEVGFGLTFAPFSGYQFTLTTAGSLTLNWSAAQLVGTPDKLTNQTSRFEIFVDGAGPTLLPINGSGQIIVPLAAGTHHFDLLDHDFGIYYSPSQATGVFVEEKTTVSFVIDGNVEGSTTPVPEPATFLLLSVGCVGLTAAARVRRLNI